MEETAGVMNTTGNKDKKASYFYMIGIIMIITSMVIMGFGIFWDTSFVYILWSTSISMYVVGVLIHLKGSQMKKEIKASQTTLSDQAPPKTI
jgi:hypothetical protein